MSEDKKLISAIVIVAIAILLVSGGTLAYWQWTTSELQSTLVNGSPAGDLNDTKMYIDFPENELTNLYPTSDCDQNGTSSWVTEITIDNKTGVVVSPNFKLKVKIEDKNGNVITNVTNPGNSNPNRYYIKFAVTEENESCQNALYTGRFDQNTQTFSGETTWYDSELITEQDETTGFPIVSNIPGSGVSFNAKPNRETSQKFRVYAWLDKEYTSLNVGTEVTDTMQDAKVTVSWSENSTLEQARRSQEELEGEAIAVYSADDRYLIFYREENPSSVTVGSTYRGRTVTEVYTDFEDASCESAVVPWGSFSSNTGVIFEDYVRPKCINYWFHGTVFPEDLSKLDTSELTTMNYVFAGTTGSLDLSSWDVSNVTDMSYMFDSLPNLTVLDISGWDTSRVTNMSYMFLGASSVQTLDLTHFDTSKVTNMEGMFSGYGDVTNNLYLDGWDTSKVTNMSYMFYESSAYLTLSLSGLEGWDTSKVTDMSYMFYGYGYNSETTLDLSAIEGWNTGNVTNMSYMFNGDTNIAYLDLSSWNVCKIPTRPTSFSSGNMLEPSWGMACPS